MKEPAQTAPPDIQLFRDVFNASPIGIAVENLEGQPLFVNSAFCSMLGFSEEELRSKHCVDFSPPEDAEKDWALFQQLRAGSIDHYQLEKRYFRRDGSLVWGSLSISLLRSGPSSLVLAMVQDITEKKTAEEARFRHAAIVESSEDAIASATLDGIIVSWNAGAQHMYGYTETEMVGKPVTILVPPELPDEENKILEALKAGGRIEQFETVRVTKTGKRINVSLSISPIKDSSGAIVGLSGIARDISDRKRREEKLREYERAVENAEEMIAVVDREYRYLIANRQFLKLRNMTQEQVVGRFAYEVVTERVFEAVVKPKLDECFQGKVVRYEMKYRYPELGERDLLVSYFPIEGAHGIDRAACILQDITDRKRAEEALRESEERLRLAVQAGKMYAYEWDIKTDVLVRSPEYVNVLAATEPQTLTHQRVLEKIHPDDRPKVLAAVARHSPENPTVEVTYRVLLPSKPPVWVTSSGRAFFDGEGRMLRVVGIVADITDQKLAEESLRASEERLRLAQQGARIGTFEWNVRTGVNTWTLELEAMYGLPPGGFGGTQTAFENLVHPDDRAEVIKLVDEALKTGQPTKGEWRVLWADGSVHWIAGRWQVFMTESGEPSRMIGVNMDITERKRAEEALRESEEKFRNVFRDAGVGMVVVSPVGRFLTANKAFCDCLGYTEEELLEKTVESVTFPEDWPAFSQKLAETLTEGRSFQWFEKRCLHKSGRIVYTESSASVIRSHEGDPQYFVGQVLDITKRKEAEEALADMSRKLLESQEQERARIARELHDDINQRLAMLAVELDQLNENPSEVGNRVQELRKQVTEVSNNVQALSHDLHSSQLEYLGAVASMKSWCKEFGERQGMQIDCRHDVRSALPPEIGLCLFRVLQEALHNAAKHSGVKRTEVQLHEESGEIHLIIRDLGKGFDIETARQGQGLGLTSMQERVRLVNGTITIESKPMGGTTIRVRVRLELGRKAQRAVG